MKNTKFGVKVDYNGTDITETFISNTLYYWVTNYYQPSQK